MFVVSAILEADKWHCRAANNRSLDLGPLAGAEIGLISCPTDEMDKADEGPTFSFSSATAGDPDLTDEDQDRTAVDQVKTVPVTVTLCGIDITKKKYSFRS